MYSPFVPMVYLRDLPNQWPFNPQAPQDLTDKEIYTARVTVEDASKLWRCPVYPPMNGFAFVAVRLRIANKQGPSTPLGSLVLGATEKPVFGMPWDNVLLEEKWCPLGFPLTHKMIAITEDGLDFLVHHSQECFGQVEFLAQRFDDLLEEEADMAYAFLNHRSDKVEWILTGKENILYKPQVHIDPVYHGKIKLIPSVLRLLDEKRQVWPDISQFQKPLNVSVPLLAFA
jgi:hypothetical protein